MSTGLECNIIEYKPGAWYYILQDWDCPVGAWDWREYATAYGPFASQEAALGSLRDNHANPGGYWIAPFDPDRPEDEVIDQLVIEAKKPAPRVRMRWY